MYALERREKEIFETLMNLKNNNFVVIGGYAVNVYALPRFSIDCDIVVKNISEAHKIEKILDKLEYRREASDKDKTPYHGEFTRYEKTLDGGFKVSFDILIGKIHDRQTGEVLGAGWIFDNSSYKELRGKTSTDRITVKIPSVESLIVMKLLSCRNTDIRDIFMMVDKVGDKEFIRREVSKKVDFDVQFKNLKQKVTSKDFKNNLQGVFGFVQEAVFERNKRKILELEN
jgi:hypothetical protein